MKTLRIGFARGVLQHLRNARLDILKVMRVLEAAKLLLYNRTSSASREGH